MGWALNLTRSDLRAAGWSPSVRLFEAAACACPIVSDSWDGIEEVLTRGREVVLADDTATLLAVLDGADAAQGRRTARCRVL